MVRGVALGLVVSIVLAGCSGKKRPFADGVGGSSATEIEQLTPDATAPGSNSGAAASGESSVADPMLLTPEPGNGIAPGSLGAPCATGGVQSAGAVRGWRLLLGPVHRVVRGLQRAG
jgi:hypothetical protein